MNRPILFLALISMLVLGAGCSSSQSSSSNDLFIGSSESQSMKPVLSNSGTILPSSANQPSQIGPQ